MQRNFEKNATRRISDTSRRKEADGVISRSADALFSYGRGKSDEYGLEMPAPEDLENGLIQFDTKGNICGTGEIKNRSEGEANSCASAHVSRPLGVAESTDSATSERVEDNGPANTSIDENACFSRYPDRIHALIRLRAALSSYRGERGPGTWSVIEQVPSATYPSIGLCYLLMIDPAHVTAHPLLRKSDEPWTSWGGKAILSMARLESTNSFSGSYASVEGSVLDDTYYDIALIEVR